MQTYTISRDGETVRELRSWSRVDAACAYGKLLNPKALVINLGNGTWQAVIHHPKLRRNDPICEPFAVAVEGGR